MDPSVRNLIEAVDAAHQALLLADNPRTETDKKKEALLGAAMQLCKQLTAVASSDWYWNALEGGTAPSDMQQWIGDLLANKDGRQADLSTLLRKCGFKPPEEAARTVRDHLASLQTASLRARIDRTALNALKPEVALATARAHFDVFADYFCAAEQRLAPGAIEWTTKKGKELGVGALKKIVKAGMTLALGAVIGSAAIPDRLPAEARDWICEHRQAIEDTIKPLTIETFCTLPYEQKTVDLLWMNNKWLLATSSLDIDPEPDPQSPADDVITDEERQLTAERHERLRKYRWENPFTLPKSDPKKDPPSE